MFNPL